MPYLQLWETFDGLQWTQHPEHSQGLDSTDVFALAAPPAGNPGNNTDVRERTGHWGEVAVKGDTLSSNACLKHLSVDNNVSSVVKNVSVKHETVLVSWTSRSSDISNMRTHSLSTGISRQSAQPNLFLSFSVRHTRVLRKKTFFSDVGTWI